MPVQLQRPLLGLVHLLGPEAVELGQHQRLLLLTAPGLDAHDAHPGGVELELVTILGLLERAYPDATIALTFTTALELVVATILAAQCTDERVNVVTRDLFKHLRMDGKWIGRDDVWIKFLDRKGNLTGCSGRSGTRPRLGL